MKAPKYLSKKSCKTLTTMIFIGLMMAHPLQNVYAQSSKGLPQGLVIEQIDQLIHRDGQTFIAFDQSKQVDAAQKAQTLTLERLLNMKKNANQTKTDRRYCLYRSEAGAPWRLVSETDSYSAWNMAVLGRINMKNTEMMQKIVPRYAITSFEEPIGANQGLFVYSPIKAKEVTVKYAVVSVPAKTMAALKAYKYMDAFLTHDTKQIKEKRTVMAYRGIGSPVLQRVEKPEKFGGVSNPTLYYYTRWEDETHSSVPNRPSDYLVAINNKVIQAKNMTEAPLGLHLHCYGGNVEVGYGAWTDAEDGAILLAGNQEPYDWWTGHHEKIKDNNPLKNPKDYAKGYVKPYTENRMISIVEWMIQNNGPFKVDKNEVFTAGASMGGSGALFLAYRHPDIFSWSRSWVGIHDPYASNMRASYEKVYGPYKVNAKMSSGASPWTYYNNVSWLNKSVHATMPFVAVSNGKNDDLIGWAQAVTFAKTLQKTKQPHVFAWGQKAHNQRVTYPLNKSIVNNPMLIRKDKTLPAFTKCSLDDPIGNGSVTSGSAEGQFNAYLYWDAATSEETANSWTMPIGLIEHYDCTVDITPRNCKVFKPKPNTVYQWTIKDSVSGEIISEGSSKLGADGLLTVEKAFIKMGVQILHIQETPQAVM